MKTKWATAILVSTLGFVSGSADAKKLVDDAEVGQAVIAEPAPQEALVFGNPEYFCRNGAFPGGGDYPGERPAFKLARVTARRGSRTQFIKEHSGPGSDASCPGTGNPQCRTNSYLVPGDQVILSKTMRGFACSWYQPKHGHETVGWLPLSSLELLEPDSHPPLGDWLGTWRRGDNTLILQRDGNGGRLRIKGQAYWPSRDLPPGHSGEVAGTAKPEKNVLILEDRSESEEYRCQVRLSLVGHQLVTSDNHKCGGANVSFDGVYLKQGR